MQQSRAGTRVRAFGDDFEGDLGQRRAYLSMIARSGGKNSFSQRREARKENIAKKTKVGFQSRSDPGLPPVEKANDMVQSCSFSLRLGVLARYLVFFPRFLTSVMPAA
jgi:hypothetical protein